MIAIEKELRAREVGFFSFIEGDEALAGIANLGVLEVCGPDAAEFLHGQVTNDVKGLAVGGGNMSARVKRTGHLVEIFSLHRLESETGDQFLLVGERGGIEALRADLDAFLFVEDVTLNDVSDHYSWFVAQGARAADALSNFGAPSEYEAGSIQNMQDVFVIARSLTGDPGYICAVPRVDGHPSEHAQKLIEASVKAGLDRYEPAVVGDLLEVLRLEAGVFRVGADTPGKDRLLPETGLEQQLVSYTKGCYLGQEVIARVRTYGSVPRALRGLVLAGEEGQEPADLLKSVPPHGSELVVDGKTIGQIRLYELWCSWRGKHFY